jgi:hypothetical protein
MAVPRIEWECPVCHRLYAIRAEMPAPDACPHCSTQAGAAVEATVIAGEHSRRRSGSDAAEMDADPSMGPDTAPQAGLNVRDGTSNERQRYRALHVMALCFKGFAAVAVVAAVAALTLMALAAFRMQNPETRTAAILLHLAEFAGCVFATLGLWCFAELIQLLVDIEANTRRWRR